MDKTILVINPGSTSTKLAIYKNSEAYQNTKILHPSTDLSKFPRVWDQYQFRMDVIKQWVREHLKECSAVVSMGGLLKPLQGGTYRINQSMINDAKANLQGEHASNLACVMADEIAKEYKCPAFTVDPISVDEFEPLARYSGHPEINRNCLSHALNIHAAARLAAAECMLPLTDTLLIICHMGGGISVAPLRGGKIIDVNDGSSDGPFTPERTGGLPLQQFITVCMSGKYTEQELRKFIMGKGGMVAYLGTNSVEEVEKRIAGGDNIAKEVYEAMAYQIAKEIGAMATVLKGKVDRIILTGGIANSVMLTSWIKERVGFIAPVMIYPGENEMLALSQGALRVLNGEEQAKEY